MKTPTKPAVPQHKRTQRVPKVLGGDMEFCNFILPGKGTERSGPERAVDLLLAEFPGIPSRRSLSGRMNLLDMGRRFLPQIGAGPYNDSSHLEWTLAEQIAAKEYLAAVRAGIAEMGDATQRINTRLSGERLRVHCNNSDLQGSSRSYGTHLNACLTREAFDDLTVAGKPMRLLASLQAALAPLLGQGKTCADNDRPHCTYQLSQRADFFHVLANHDTMVNRGLVNLRDESHTGALDDELARLHIICFDATLADTATFLRAGVMQIALAMFEAEFMDESLILDQPVTAFREWSHDPSLGEKKPASGRRFSLVEWLQRFHEHMGDFVNCGGCDGVVPDAELILETFAGVLDLAARRDMAALSRKLDWALKLAIISQAVKDHGIKWGGPQTHTLDLFYSAADDGLFFDFEKSGAVDRIITDADIERHRHTAPEATRAWTRSRLLQLADPAQVALVDWDRVIFDLTDPAGRSVRAHVSLPCPWLCGKDDCGINGETTLGDALAALDAKHHNVTISAPLKVFWPAPAPHDHRTEAVAPSA